MGGIAVQLTEEPRFLGTMHGSSTEVVDGVQYPMKLSSLGILLQRNVIELPVIPKEALQERSKADEFAKTVTLFQVSWFVIVTFSRFGQGLAVSLFEVSTLAFVCCTAFVAYFRWHKPLDLRTCTVIKIPKEKENLFVSVYSTLDFELCDQDMAESIDPMGFFRRAMRTENAKFRAGRMTLMGCVFNCIHIAAWSFEFPTDVERLLWRLSSVATTVSVLVMYVILLLYSARISLWFCVLIGAPAYVLDRIVLMVEIFVSMRSMPYAVYEESKLEGILRL